MHRQSFRLALVSTMSAIAASPTSAQSPHEHAPHSDSEHIIITATPLAHTRDELAIPVDRITRREILDRVGPTIGETLDRLPGVASTGFTAGANRPVIRGQNAYRTEVLEDSLTTQGLSRQSPDHGEPVNPLAAQAIEIVRGPATLRYGGGAIAGVVNIITSRVPQRMPSDASRIDAYGSYGSNSDEGMAAVVATGAADRFAWHLDGVYQRADDYETGAGSRQPGSHYKGGAVAAGGAWIAEGARLGGSYVHLRKSYGLPETSHDGSIEMDTNRYRLEADIDAPLPYIRKLRFLGVYSDYEHSEIVEGTAGQTFDNDEFDGRLELLHEPVSGFDGAFGITGQHRDFSAGGESAQFLSPTENWQVAGYLFEERRITDAIEAQLGLRIEGSSIRGTPLSGAQMTRHFVPVSGSVGLLMRPGDGFTLGLTGAVSQRAPGDVELFARGPHEATGTFEIGAPNLDPETAYTGELRLEGEIGPLHYDTASFIARYERYIFGDLTGIAVDENGDPTAPGPDALDQLRYGARDALFYGGELTVSADLFELGAGTVRLDTQFDWVRARFQNVPAGENANVPLITPIRWGAGIAYHGAQLRGRVGFLRSERQRNTGEGETPTDAYTLLDLDIAWTLSLSGERLNLELSLAAHNLTDEAARNPIAINKDRILLPGRTVRLGLRGQF